MNMLAFMYVGIGGGVGAMARYFLASLISEAYGKEFPYGTLAVNVLGCFLMGVLVAVIATMLPARAKDLHLLLAVGFLGGFTTFSAFSIDLFLLAERGAMMQAAVYMVGSVVISVLALIAGMWLVRGLAA